MKKIFTLRKNSTINFFIAMFILCTQYSYGKFADNFIARGHLVYDRPTAYISGTTSICKGQSAIVTIAVTGTGNISGTLSDGSGFSGTAPSILLSKTPSANITYTVVTLSDANGAALPSDLSGAASITVNARPTGSISSGDTICSGQSTNLTLTVTGSGTIHGTLSDGTPFSGSAPAITISVSPFSNITYTIATLEDDNCTAGTGDKTGSALVTVNARPTSILSGNSVICVGQTFAIPITVSGNGNITGTLSNGSAFSGTAPMVYAMVSPAVITSYTVATLNDATCIAQSSNMTGAYTVNVNAALINYHSVFYENFDNGYTLPNGWLSSPVNYWSIEWASSSTGYTGASAYRNAVAHNNDPMNTSLISPAIDFSAHTDARLSFGLRKTATFARNLIIEASVDNFATIVYTKTILNANFPTATYWGLQTINLGNTIDHASSVKIRWRLMGGPGGGTGNIRIDDITLSSATPEISPSGPVAICSGGNITLTSSAGSTYLWSPNNETTQSIVVTSAGSYSVQINGCATSPPAVVTVNSSTRVNVSIAASANPVCSDTSVTLTATPTNEGTAPVYQWKVNGANVGGNSPNYSYIPLHGDNVTCILTSNASCAQGSPDTSNTLIMSVTETPAIISVIPDSICGAGSLTLGALSSVGSINWYYVSTGDTSIGIGNSFTTMPITTTTTYYVDAIYHGCISSERTPVAAIINSIPDTVAVSGGGIYCGSATLNATGGLVGTIYWQGSNRGGTSTATPSISEIVTSSGTYYFRSLSLDGCWGPEGSATVSIFAVPDAPTGNTPQSFCSGSTVANLQANGSNIQWYLTSSGGLPLSLGTTLVNGNHYYASQAAGECVSDSRLDVTVIITNPNAPTGNANQYFCSANSPRVSNLVANGSNIQWYTTSSGGTALSPTTALVNGVHYYASQTVNGCESNTRFNVTVTIYSVPTVSLGPDPSVCRSTTSAQLYKYGSSGVPVVYSIDYDNAANGIGFNDVTNAGIPSIYFNLIIPANAPAGTYHGTLTVNNGTAGSGCNSNAYPISVTVNPVYTSIENHTLCDGGIFNWHGQDITTAGTYYDINQSVAGCDSSYTLNLTVSQGYSFTENHSMCDGKTYNWHGQTLTTTGVYHAYYTTASGCDSNYTLNLSVTQVIAYTEYNSICQGVVYAWHGQNLTTSGTYFTIYTNTIGGDSVSYTLYLKVKPMYAFTENHTINPGDTYIWQGQSLTIAGTYHANYLTVNGCDSTYTLYLGINNGSKTLTLKLFFEGLYAGGGLMLQAKGLSGAQFAPGIADQVTVELHDAISPYPTAYSYSNADLNTNGMTSINTIPGIISGAYYVVVKHRNSIETWSALPVDLSGSGTINYNFTTAAGQAYGANLKSMGGVYAIWGGNTTQDGVVDGSDLAAVDNASVSILTGYYPEDINGDGVVDGSDLAMVDNNSTAIIQVFKP